tara:strand:- start:5160 stop:5465 length:306 start_codon:yes stop_codon:yes gene_type:complete
MYKFEKAIAKGSYGQISKIEKDGKEYAIKEFIINGRTKNFFGALYLKEVDFLKRCNHPNIMKVSTITYSCPYDGGQKLYQSGIRDDVFASSIIANTLSLIS